MILIALDVVILFTVLYPSLLKAVGGVLSLTAVNGQKYA